MVNELDIAREKFDCFAGFVNAKNEFCVELNSRFRDREILLQHLSQCNLVYL